MPCLCLVSMGYNLYTSELKLTTMKKQEGFPKYLVLDTNVRVHILTSFIAV